MALTRASRYVRVSARIRAPHFAAAIPKPVFDLCLLALPWRRAESQTGSAGPATPASLSPVSISALLQLRLSRFVAPADFFLIFVHVPAAVLFPFPDFFPDFPVRARENHAQTWISHLTCATISGISSRFFRLCCVEPFQESQQNAAEAPRRTHVGLTCTWASRARGLDVHQHCFSARVVDPASKNRDNSQV